MVINQNRMLEVMDGSGEAQNPFFLLPPFCPCEAGIISILQKLCSSLSQKHFSAIVKKTKENSPDFLPTACLELKTTSENCPDFPDWSSGAARSGPKSVAYQGIRNWALGPGWPKKSLKN